MPDRRERNAMLGRREVLLGTAAAAAAGVVGAGAEARGDTPPSPRRGGHFRAGLTGASTSDNMDPALASSTFTSMMPFTVGNGLTEIDAENKLVPELAKSWAASTDFKTWTFELRRGIEFHNGKTLTIQDVIDSLNRHRGPNSKSAMASIMKPVRDIKADGKSTLVITLDSGSADFPYVFSGQHAAIVLPDRPDYSKVIGTGPYMVEKFDPGVGLYTKRNPNYWKDGRGHFDRVDLLGVNDPNARTTALLAGEIDAMDRVSSKLVPWLRKSRAIDIVNKVGYQHCTMPMRNDRAPFDNLDVRLAIKHAIDREGILKRVLGGFGALGNDHPVSPIQKFCATGIPQRKYDPDKARFHLKKAGESAIAVDLQVAEAAFTGAVDAAVLFQDSARKCGITINVKREPDDGYWSRVWLKSPWCVAYWSGRPTADWILTLGYAAHAKWNECHWDNPTFNALLVAARVERNEAKRAEMYAELEQLVRDDSGQIVPFFINHVYARQNKVRAGRHEGGNFDMDGYRCAERWWFA